MTDPTDTHPRRRYTVTFDAQPWQPDTFPTAIRSQILLLPAYVEHVEITTGPDHPGPGRPEPRGGDTRWQTPTSP